MVGSKLPFWLSFTLYLRAVFQVQAPGGAYIWRDDLMEGFLRYRFGGIYLEGLLHGQAYFPNFTVCFPSPSIRWTHSKGPKGVHVREGLL